MGWADLVGDGGGGGAEAAEPRERWGCAVCGAQSDCPSCPVCGVEMWASRKLRHTVPVLVRSQVEALLDLPWPEFEGGVVDLGVAEGSNGEGSGLAVGPATKPPLG